MSLNKILALVALAYLPSAFAAPKAPQLNYKDTTIAQDVFAVKAPGEASFYILDMPYLDWKSKSVGQFINMEVAPIFRGRATGGVQLPKPTTVDVVANKYEDQMLDFAEAVNSRNVGGRQKFETKERNAGMSPEKALAFEEANTYVVQAVLSTLVNRPSSTFKFTTEQFAKMPETIDAAHAHYIIPGTLALDALEEDHVAGKVINPKGAYLMSAIDLKAYQCQGMQQLLNDEFAKRPEKQRLWRDSIYMISDMQVNNPADIDAMQKYLGKRPDTVLSQNVLYADHLLRGGRTLFAFIPEGAQTRIVLISNIAINKSYMAGSAKALIARPRLMDGMGAGTDVLNATKKLLQTGDAKQLISKVDMDLLKKNKCDKGLAVGLKAYSKTMFSVFVDAISK